MADSLKTPPYRDKSKKTRTSAKTFRWTWTAVEAARRAACQVFTVLRLQAALLAPVPSPQVPFLNLETTALASTPESALALHARTNARLTMRTPGCARLFNANSAHPAKSLVVRLLACELASQLAGFLCCFHS